MITHLLIRFNIIQIYFSFFTCEFLSFSWCGEAEASVSLCIWKGKEKKRDRRGKGKRKGEEKEKERKLSDYSPFNKLIKYSSRIIL